MSIYQKSNHIKLAFVIQLAPPNVFNGNVQGSNPPSPLLYLLNYNIYTHTHNWSFFYVTPIITKGALVVQCYMQLLLQLFAVVFLVHDNENSTKKSQTIVGPNTFLSLYHFHLNNRFNFLSSTKNFYSHMQWPYSSTYHFKLLTVLNGTNGLCGQWHWLEVLKCSQPKNKT